MGDSDQNVKRIAASADFLEWNFSIIGQGSLWSVEQGMTQLLAHQSAEGFGPSLVDAVQDDAKVIYELGRRTTPKAVAALRAFQAMSRVDTQRELARANADRLVRQGLAEPPWAAQIGGYGWMAAGGRTTSSTRPRSCCLPFPTTELTNTPSWS